MIKKMIKKKIEELGDSGTEFDRRYWKACEESYDEGEVEGSVRPDGTIEWCLTEKGMEQEEKYVAEGLRERRVCPDGTIEYRLSEKGKAKYYKENQ